MDTTILHYHKKKRKFATDGFIIESMQEDVESWQLSGEENSDILFPIFKQATGLDVELPQIFNQGKFVRLGPRGICYIAVFDNVTQFDQDSEGANVIKAMNALIVKLDAYRKNKG
ncbi:MAG: hypothetical protein H6576_09745 [Lewinellaceae bacterium]|nr:hypothetical protein [Lewinellaceae bacterium]